MNKKSTINLSGVPQAILDAAPCGDYRLSLARAMKR
jgi:hypothetical protein